MMHSMRAVRRTGPRLVLTSIGRRLLAHPDRLWAAATRCLIGDGDSLGVAAREAAMVVLVDGRQLGREELARRVTTMLAGDGWHDPASGGAPVAPAVRVALADLWSRLSALGLLADERWLRPLRLSPIGQAAALAALQARAIRPRHAIGFG